MPARDRRTPGTALHGIRYSGLHLRSSYGGNSGGLIVGHIYGRPNAYSELPAAIATYCLPSTAKLIGEAYTAPPIWKCQSGLPEAASSAIRLPSASPVNSRPPAVDNTPDQVGDVCGNSHFTLPDSGSIARTAPR